jgi:hypothetical protein
MPIWRTARQQLAVNQGNENANREITGVDCLLLSLLLFTSCSGGSLSFRLCMVCELAAVWSGSQRAIVFYCQHNVCMVLTGQLSGVDNQDLECSLLLLWWISFCKYCSVSWQLLR